MLRQNQKKKKKRERWKESILAAFTSMILIVPAAPLASCPSCTMVTLAKTLLLFLKQMELEEKEMEGFRNWHYMSWIWKDE